MTRGAASLEAHATSGTFDSEEIAGLLSGESLRAGQVYCFDGTYSLGARYSPHFFQPLRAL